MTERKEISAWRETDASFEKRFDQSGSISIRHLIGKLLRRNSPPSLNEYRDHLLEGYALGVLPLEDTSISTQSIEHLASIDYDELVATDHEGLKTDFMKRQVAKVAMDFQAGKIGPIQAVARVLGHKSTEI